VSQDRPQTALREISERLASRALPHRSEATSHMMVGEDGMFIACLARLSHHARLIITSVHPRGMPKLHRPAVATPQHQQRRGHACAPCRSHSHARDFSVAGGSLAHVRCWGWRCELDGCDTPCIFNRHLTLLLAFPTPVSHHHLPTRSSKG
jgi:hypothetical protein